MKKANPILTPLVLAWLVVFLCVKFAGAGEELVWGMGAVTVILFVNELRR